MNQEQRKEAMYQAGRAEALNLQGKAQGMTGTEIISQERDVPEFVPGKDYSVWPAGAPVSDDGQVWQLIQPYDSTAHPGRPGELRALWGLCHTTDPAKAKAWVDPLGTSGMYMAGECYRAGDGRIYRCLADNTVHDAAALPEGWEVAV